MGFRVSKAVLIGLVVVLVCGGAVVWAVSSKDEPTTVNVGNPESKAVDYEQALEGAPPELTKLYANGDAIIPGGVDELHRKLASVRGYPAVVNAWASWCGPCRFEFPHFQEAAANVGKRIAFLGVDTDDSDAAARSYLDELPLPYPSISDPGRDIFDEYNIRFGLPATGFYDANGKLVFVKQGPYESTADLLADINRYAS
jgi:cytochrome c biogenesis protein CcmG, thiol:disulfide interchange protein DsbE